MAEGIKETKEAVIGVLALGTVIAKELKDGAQLQDIVAIFNGIQNDPVKKAKFDAAVADIAKVPNELRDLNMAETFELMTAVIAELPALLEAIKK